MGASAATSPPGKLNLRRPLMEACALSVIVLAVTAVSWALRPDRLPLSADPTFYKLELDAPLIATKQAVALYDAGTHLFVDTRPGPIGATPTIPGSVPIRQDSFDDDLLDLFDFITPEDPLILFGDGNLSLASSIAARLKARGYVDLEILSGGLEAWRAAGAPLTGESGP
ncbi:hypothetical protein CO151_10860 [bacterium CG_4_9_14_3_um_filter_65_15]|nr:MAG: hypothetical protein CO151_10860 [bacterium CG_4_9_14_3_um_filter_65_15]